MKLIFVGLDLGQASDPSALASMEATEGAPGPDRKPQLHYQCNHLERFPLNSSYEVIAAYVAKFIADLKKPDDDEKDAALDRDEEPRENDVRLAVDGGGVGRAVTDMLRGHKLSFADCTITSGANVRHEDGKIYLPKRELVSTAKIVLDGRRFKFSDHLAEHTTLIREMQNYQVKITNAANATFAAARESVHDDLLFAVMLAVWLGQSGLGAPTTISEDAARALGII